MKNNFYTYIHVKPYNGEIFYVGKGKGDRAYQGGKNRRSEYWNRVVNKYGLDIFILENNLSEEEALELEMKYIKRVGRRDLNTGTLVNMTDGGDGAVGISEETRRKISEAKVGKKHSEETRRKISEGNKGRKRSEESRQKMSKSQTGKKLSEETKKKISESHMGNKYAKGMKHSEETKSKISESAKKAWADRKAKAAK